jgi:tRNA(fMet)-specific endonuclease VapC
MIFDTTFVIDIMKNDEKAVKKLQEIIKKGETQMVTSLTVFELFSGLARSKKPLKEKNKIMNTLKGQVILHLDNTSAERGGKIDGTLIKEGNMIGPIDSMIAGIALIKKEKVLTRNTKDFTRIDQLEVESY